MIVGILSRHSTSTQTSIEVFSHNLVFVSLTWTYDSTFGPQMYVYGQHQELQVFGPNDAERLNSPW